MFFFLANWHSLYLLVYIVGTCLIDVDIINEKENKINVEIDILI